MGYDKRRPSEAFYSTSQWRRRLRPLQLTKQPLCSHCLDRGEIVLASEVHHKVAHNGDFWLQRDPDNLLSLCKPCHSRVTHGKGYSEDVGVDGFKTDPKHPTNKKAVA